MLYAVLFLRPLGIVEPIQGPHEVACNPADTLELDAFTNYPALWLWFLHRPHILFMQHPCELLWVTCPYRAETP